MSERCDFCDSVLLKNLDSARHPVYNCANLSCQQLSQGSTDSSSEWVWVTLVTEVGEGIDPMELSFTTVATAGSEGEGDSSSAGARRERDTFPSFIQRQETSLSESQDTSSIDRWVSEVQGPWCAIAVAQESIGASYHKDTHQSGIIRRQSLGGVFTPLEKQGCPSVAEVDEEELGGVNLSFIWSMMKEFGI